MLLITLAALVNVSAAPVQAKAGSDTELHVNVQVSEGWHVQANPPSEDYLIPTRLDLAAADGIAIDKVSYPAAKKFRLQGSNKEFNVYDGNFDVVVKLKLPASLTPGEHKLKGELGYQACDARSCRPPTSAPVEVTVTVTAPAKKK
jgi:DsbC/DsbD-like thiol-disulfide interchange protein